MMYIFELLCSVITTVCSGAALILIFSLINERRYNIKQRCDIVRVLIIMLVISLISEIIRAVTINIIEYTSLLIISSCIIFFIYLAWIVVSLELYKVYSKIKAVIE